MKISIVITLMNDKNVIKTIDSILEQTLLPNEIIVADAGDDKELYEKIKSYGGIVKIKKIYGSIAESRNKTIPMIKNEIIVFIDSDEKAPKEWLKKLIDPILKRDIDFVGGRTKNMYKPKNKMEEYVYRKSDFCYDEIYKKDVAKIHMGNTAWKREIFDKIGNFDEKLKWGGEDYDINIRALNAGFRGEFSDDAWVWHDRGMDTIGKWIRKRYKYHTGSTIVYLKNKIDVKKKEGSLSIGNHPLDYLDFLLKIFAFIRGNLKWRQMQ